MSFSHNPYKHLEIILNEENGRWYWTCHSCGADAKTDWEAGSPLDVFIDDFFHHIEKSHGRTSEDFEGWSKY